MPFKAVSRFEVRARPRSSACCLCPSTTHTTWPVPSGAPEGDPTPVVPPILAEFSGFFGKS